MGTSQSRNVIVGTTSYEAAQAAYSALPAFAPNSADSSALHLSRPPRSCIRGELCLYHHPEDDSTDCRARGCGDSERSLWNGNSSDLLLGGSVCVRGVAIQAV